MQTFNVALWRRGTSLWPEWFGTVEAASAYAAIVQLMTLHRVSRIARGTALAKDGRIRYRCFGLVLRVPVVQQANQQDPVSPLKKEGV